MKQNSTAGSPPLFTGKNDSREVRREVRDRHLAGEEERDGSRQEAER